MLGDALPFFRSSGTHLKLCDADSGAEPGATVR